MLRGGDSINPGALPNDLEVFFGYGDGRWPDYQAIANMHPGKRLFKFAVSANDDGDILDIENTDATDAQAPGWVRRQLARGLHRPGLYRAVSGLMSLRAELEGAALSLAEVTVGSAHYGSANNGPPAPHVCGPASCAWPGLNFAADGTQWIDHGSWDEWLLAPSFVEVPMPTLNRPVCTIVARPQGDGYWLIAQDGGIFAFGAAPALGTNDPLPAEKLSGLIEGAASTPNGAGLWLVGSDGGIFTFGDAEFFGSLPAQGFTPSTQAMA